MAGLEIMVVAGEASGDVHAAQLVAALKRRLPEARFFGMGGSQLEAQGVELLYGAHEVSVMGITEVLPKLWRILSVMQGLKEEAARRRPSCAILVDIPDFNLRLAKKLKSLGIRVAYYISPMVWAWRPGRVKHIARYVDQMLCILPFEEAFYHQAGVLARYVGNPVLEQVPPTAEATRFREALALPAERPTLALLPGSRMSEVRRTLPAMAGAAKKLAQQMPGLQVVVPVAPTIPREVVQTELARSGVSATLVSGRAAEVVGASDVAIVTSGTATLEAGLMERPLVVVYRVSLISYWVGRALLKVAHIALVNLLARKRLVPELIQGQMTPDNIAAEVRALWSGPRRAEVIEGLRAVRSTLGEAKAAERAADAVVALLKTV